MSFLCLHCGGPTRVCNSRLSSWGGVRAVRRRRVCMRCDRRVTTFEFSPERTDVERVRAMARSVKIAHGILSEAMELVPEGSDVA